MPLDDGARSAARRSILWDGVFSRLMDALTGGALLAGLGLYLGSGTFLLGVLAALPMLAQVGQFVAVPLLLRVPDRRRVVVASSTASRIALVVLALWLIQGGRGLDPWILVLLLAANALLAIVSAAAC